MGPVRSISVWLMTPTEAGVFSSKDFSRLPVTVTVPSAAARPAWGSAGTVATVGAVGAAGSAGEGGGVPCAIKGNAPKRVQAAATASARECLRMNCLQKIQ